MREGQMEGISRLGLSCTFLGCDMDSKLVSPHVKTQPYLTVSYWPDGTINNSLKPEQNYFSTQCSPTATRATIFWKVPRLRPTILY